MKKRRHFARVMTVNWIFCLSCSPLTLVQKSECRLWKNEKGKCRLWKMKKMKKWKNAHRLIFEVGDILRMSHWRNQDEIPDQTKKIIVAQPFGDNERGE